MRTDIERQLWLARKLPELIKILNPGEQVNKLLNTTITRFYWIGKRDVHWSEITPREWGWVVRQVENKLCEKSGEHGEHYSQRDLYAKQLMKINGTWSGNGWDWGDMCDADLFRAANCSWQQRTDALMSLLEGDKV